MADGEYNWEIGVGLGSNVWITARKTNRKQYKRAETRFGTRMYAEKVAGETTCE